MDNKFRLAPMSPLIRSLTILLLALPLLFIVGVWFGHKALVVPTVLIIAIYAWIWLCFRPSLFIVNSEGLKVKWPLKHRQISRENIRSVRIINNQELKMEIGWGMRIGAGGLWGGFGWLWTKRRGIVQMYVSRTDGFVWIECVSGRPWLVTPEKPEMFVSTLAGT